MFRYQETTEGVLEYYVTKKGKAVRILPGQPPPNTFDVPSIRPLVAEKDVKDILFQLYEKRATESVGIFHGKDIDYLGLRKSKQSVRALSRASGSKFEVLPGSAKVDERVVGHPDFDEVMTREEVASALYRLYSHKAPATSQRGNGSPVAKQPREAVKAGNLAKDASTSGTASPSRSPGRGSSLPPLPSCPQVCQEQPRLNTQGCPDLEEEVKALSAKLEGMHRRTVAELAEARRNGWDLEEFIRQARKRLPLAFLFRTAMETWLRMRAARAFRTWKLLVDDQQRAAVILATKAPQALCIQRVYRGLRGRRRHEHFRHLRDFVNCLSHHLTRHSLRVCFACWKMQLASWQDEEKRRMAACIRIQACWRGFRHGRCVVRYMWCKVLMQALRELGGGHLFRLHRMRLGEKEDAEIARVLNLALTPFKPLKALPRKRTLKSAIAFVKRCQAKVHASRAPRLSPQARKGQAEATKRPLSRHSNRPPSPSREGVTMPPAQESVAKRASTPLDKLGLGQVVRQDTWVRLPGRQDPRLDALQSQERGRQAGVAEARERELMLVEDYRSGQAERRGKEEDERQEREATERRRLHALGKDGHAKNKAHASQQRPPAAWQCIKLGNRELLVGVWPTYGSRAAAVKEALWVLHRSEQLLSERRAAYFRTAQVRRWAEEACKGAKEQLKQLKVKMTIERRHKEAHIASLQVELDVAQEAEAAAGRDLRSILHSHVKLLGSTLKVKPFKFGSTTSDKELVAMTAAVGEWAAKQGRRFVRSKTPAYVEAMQRLQYLNSAAGEPLPTDARWRIAAAKASVSSVLQALASVYALQVRVVKPVKQEGGNDEAEAVDGSSSQHWTPENEVYSTVVEEEALTNVLGRKSYSAHLHALLKASAEARPKRSSGRLDASVVLGPMEKQEYTAVLQVLAAHLATGREGISLKPIQRDHNPIASGPNFSWNISRYEVCVRPTGILEVSLSLRDTVSNAQHTLSLSKEEASLAMTGFCLRHEVCENCCSVAAEVKCRSGRHLCAACLGLLYRTEERMEVLPPVSDPPPFVMGHLRRLFRVKLAATPVALPSHAAAGQEDEGADKTHGTAAEPQLDTPSTPLNATQDLADEGTADGPQDATVTASEPAEASSDPVEASEGALDATQASAEEEVLQDEPARISDQDSQAPPEDVPASLMEPPMETASDPEGASPEEAPQQELPSQEDPPQEEPQMIAEALEERPDTEVDPPEASQDPMPQSQDNTEESQEA